MGDPMEGVESQEVAPPTQPVPPEVMASIVLCLEELRKCLEKAPHAIVSTCTYNNMYTCIPGLPSLQASTYVYVAEWDADVTCNTKSWGGLGMIQWSYKKITWNVGTYLLPTLPFLPPSLPTPSPPHSLSLLPFPFPLLPSLLPSLLSPPSQHSKTPSIILTCQ